MKKIVLTITKISQHSEMQLHGYISHNGNLVKHTPMTMYMKIWAKDENGNDYFFKTPGFNYNEASGFLSYKSFDENNNWFKVIKGQIDGVKGTPMFDGGETPNICITDNTEAIPTCNIGNTIEIKAKENGIGKPNNIYSKGLIFLNRVKLLKVA